MICNKMIEIIGKMKNLITKEIATGETRINQHEGIKRIVNN